MKSTFMMQILRVGDNEVVAQWPPGHRDGRLGRTQERDFVAALADAVCARKVGLFRTTAHVRAEVIEAIHGVLDGVKSRV